MITRVVKQVKVFDVKAHQEVMYEQGMKPWTIPGLSWVNGQIWKSDAECEQCLNEAITDWQNRRNENPWGTTSHKPELVVYWQTIDIQENNA
jgi:hypothetical protein